ncbi:serine hydrolase [Altererythrobacter aquiaggeris]|uniref:serine hydrolase n=1 Tax=Aestuarierythrobacter aquiaggeris TaxID=1898396 RepID=UPI003016EBA4
MGHFTGVFGKISAALALGFAVLSPAGAQAQSYNFENAFDRELGTDTRAPRDYSARYDTPLERQIAMLAGGDQGRIGVAAIDLETGREVAILGDQRFPMASTSKIAIAATYLEGVDQGRWSLEDRYPLLIPVQSAKFSSRAAPVKRGSYLPASELIELMITRSSNSATDAMIAAVGGTDKVNDWLRRSGIEHVQIDRDIATLVRDDGEFDPAIIIDKRDSATPRAMVALLSGLYQGRWLTPRSRDVVIGAMERCRTGKRRIPHLLPGNALVAHKTGSLNNTSSDVGVITAPDGRSMAVAIYVTGQGSRANREAKIAAIASAIYNGYTKPQQRGLTRSAY